MKNALMSTIKGPLLMNMLNYHFWTQKLKIKASPSVDMSL